MESDARIGLFFQMMNNLGMEKRRGRGARNLSGSDEIPILFITRLEILAKR